jgi:hypothetical protein
MMYRHVLATLLVAASVSSMAGRTHAAPLGASLTLRDAMPQNVETVQWRGRGGWGGGGWGGRGWGGRGWGGGFGGVGLGLATGALIGGALAAPYYGGYSYYDDGYDYGYSPAYYGGYYAPRYYGYEGGYWPRYRHRIHIVRRPYWGGW